MELTTWTAAEQPHVRVVDDGARLELQLPQGEGTEQELELMARELWGKLEELRSVLRGEF